jgi:hypothetical protein
MCFDLPFKAVTGGAATIGGGLLSSSAVINELAGGT